MPYTSDPKCQEQLRTAIQHDLRAEKGKRRSAAAIIRAVNVLLEGTGRKEKVISETDNTSRYIRNFATGQGWNDDNTKALLFELYEHEQGIVSVARGTLTPEKMSALLGYFFESPPNAQPLADLHGKFLVYKKAIKAPNELVVRGIIEFMPGPNNVIQVKEVHVNRSHADKPTRRGKQKEPVIEAWDGTLVARERSYCLVTKEQAKGTPKFAVLETIHTAGGKAMSLCGESIECVESWGTGRTFRSRIYLERVDDDFDYLKESRVDLVAVKELQKTHAYVIRHLGMGGV